MCAPSMCRGTCLMRVLLLVLLVLLVLTWFCVRIFRVVLHGVAAPVSLVTRCTARAGRRNFDCECSERCKYDTAACCAASLPQSAKLRVPLVRADELSIAVMPAAFFGESGSQRPLRVK